MKKLKNVKITSVSNSRAKLRLNLSSLKEEIDAYHERIKKGKVAGASKIAFASNCYQTLFLEYLLCSDNKDQVIDALSMLKDAVEYDTQNICMLNIL